MEREELLRNSGYWTSKIQIDLFNNVKDYIETKKFSRSRLAKKLNVTRGYITQVLNGDFDHRISKLVELSLAVGKVPKIEFEDLESYIEKDSIGYKEIKWGCIKNPFLNYSSASISYTGIEKSIDLKQNNTKEDIETLSVVNFY
jgi:transcriptional regulator with XRE-family HTH domain